MSDPAVATPALDPRSFKSFIANEPGPVVIDFHAPWCGPCLALAPRLDKLARQFEGRIQVRKVDIDGAPDLIAAYGVRGIPTLMLFKDGQPHSTLVGLHDEARLSSWMRAAL